MVFFEIVFVESPAELLLKMSLEPIRLRPQAGVDRFAIFVDQGEKLGQDRDQKVVTRHNVDEKIIGDFANLK